MRDSKHYGVKSLEEEENTSVVRKFINSAVYIESSTTNMLSQNPLDCGQFKVKKCVCTTVRETCPCHPDKITTKTHSVKVSPLSSKSSVQTDSGYSGDTILEKDDLRLSLTSLTANSSINSRNEENRQKVFQEWLAKKKKEEQIKQMLEEKLQMEREIERAKKEAEERENFRKWLMNKRKEEQKKKLEQQRKEEQERIKSAQPKHDPEEKEMALKAWLKRKEQETIERKIKEKEEELRVAEEKQKRLEESARAYEEWLKSSKYKPKPIPLNRGIDSLKSSASVTYINPAPWIPNIEQQRNL